MTKKFAFAVAMLALLTSTAPAHAAIIHWNLENVTAVGDPAVTVTGSFDFDTTAALPVTNLNLTVSGLGAPFTLSIPSANDSLAGGYFGPDSFQVFNAVTADQQVALDLGGLGIFGGFLPGSTFPLISSLSYVVGDGREFNLQGSLSDDPPSPVPLPAALPLFGSPVLGLAGFAWRRGKVSA